MKRSPMKRKPLPRTPDERWKFAWIGGLSCCLTGRTDIHVAHLHEAELTSLNQKVGPELTLPLCWLLHAEQHRTREFWPQALPGERPSDWALRLHDLFESDDRHGAELLLLDMQEKASRDYLATILRKAVA